MGVKDSVTGASTLIKNMSDDAKSEERLNVLYSPFRKRDLNPQDWESKMTFWKLGIMNWCLECNSFIFTLAKLQTVFVRNGRPSSCLPTVVDDMVRNNEIVALSDLLRRDPSTQTWSSWAVNSLVKAPIAWSFTKLKESLVTKPETNAEEKYVHLEVLKKTADQLKNNCKRQLGKKLMSLEEVSSVLKTPDELCVKVTLHWLQLQGQAVVTTVGNKKIVKLSADKERVQPMSEADIGVYHLKLNEQALTQMLEQLEREKQEAEEEARNYLRKGMRQVAKSCLHKKKVLENCITKRATALENVQVLLSRVKDAESDGEILESYKMGLAALKDTFKNAGLSEDSVGHTMDQVHEVLEAHEEIQSALAEPMAAKEEEDLENELAELLLGAQESAVRPETPKQRIHLPDFPEPPVDSPSRTPTKSTAKVAQSILQ